MISFFIDTGVFISTFKTDNASFECERFIRRVRNGFFKGCLFSQLRKVDNRVEDGDILHATCAKILNIPLVTIDGKLLRSRGLKDQGVEILHPKRVLDEISLSDS